MKLTTQHIELLRKYFLANNKEEQAIIQDSMEPGFPASLFYSLTDIFNNNTSSDDALYRFVKTLGAEDWFEPIQQLQRDYYSHLAFLRISGIANSNVQLLLQNNHADFLAELDFQKELDIAFRLHERNTLKQQFGNAGSSGGDLNNEEISLAFKLGERQRLKEQFQDIEQTGNKTPATVVKFNWKRLTIAASVTGIMLIGAFMIFNKTEKTKNIASQVAVQKNDPGVDFASDEFAKQASAELAKVISPENVHTLPIKKEQSMGFTAKEETTNLVLYDFKNHIDTLKDRIDTLNKIIFTSSKKRASDSLLLMELKHKADSLNALTGKYKFNTSTLVLYTDPKKPVEVYKIDSNYYMQIGNSIYQCRKSTIPLPMKKNTDKLVQTAIDIINLN